MELLKVLFWILFLVVFYTYIGYGLVLFVLVRLKRLFAPAPKVDTADYLPEVTLLMPAYNEKDYVDQKIRNSMALDYPAN